jgi:hypothetical protein
VAKRPLKYFHLKCHTYFHGKEVLVETVDEGGTEVWGLRSIKQDSGDFSQILLTYLE